ncbi:MAG: AAA family ATPase [Oscillospiraceae bacterium]|nr:AAA family ATPase [Oscillospiraceae bacterium]
MGILITKVRIENYRSIESMEVSLSETNVIIGANNSGKSNFLRAINVALGQTRVVSSDDIHINNGEVVDETKYATIDLMIRPCDSQAKEMETFSDFWIGVFTDSWITTGSVGGDFVGIRTIIQYDVLKNYYMIVHKQITDWGDSISTSSVSRKKIFTGDMNTYISAFYMDAQRDVVDDIRDKKSYFGRATSRIKLPEDKTADIERQLNDINSQIVDSIPALKQTANSISSIAPTVGNPNGTIEIEPLARKLSDLHKGMDIFYRDGDAARLSVSQHGMGTRSWISFLTLGTYIEWEKKNLVEDDPESESFVVLTMEEPEAHLHPQAQQKLYTQIKSFSGQKIISTHSPSIVSQAELSSLIHFEKKQGKTIANRFDKTKYSNEEINRIKREVVSSHGDLLFSRAIVLCEGVTEEQALPMYFEKYFGVSPSFWGISIIGIGGQNYKTFLSLIRDFNIDWYIFSDGEDSTIKTVKKAVKKVFSAEIEDCNNIIILENKEDFEKHLINSGYVNEIVEAICDYEENPDFVTQYIRTRDQKSDGRKKTNLPKCPTCKQDIYADVIKDYSGTEGYNKAVYDCCTDKQAKAKYATVVADKIVNLEDDARNIPPKIKQLLIEMQRLIVTNERDDESESIQETTSNS